MSVIDDLMKLEMRRSYTEKFIDAQKSRVNELEAASQRLKIAQDLLSAFTLYRKRQAAIRLSTTVSGGLQCVMGGNISASLGDEDAMSNAKVVNVMVTTNGVTQDVRRGCGRSVRAVTDFCVWLDLFCALKDTHGLRPFVCFDEPFLALHPDRYERVRALLLGLVDLGVQVVVCTNQTGMIPEGAAVVEVRKSDG